ncbi:MAG: GNAT family N-acetyltransferase [Rubrobacter sp.]
MSLVGQIEYVNFEPQKHLSGVLALCEAEGWSSWGHPDRARGALEAPGVTTVVAAREGGVIGFVQMQSDGVLQAHLSYLAVDRRFRKQGTGRRLVEEAFLRCGAERVDLISTTGVEGFYESFPHKARSGFRIYPARQEVR